MKILIVEDDSDNLYVLTEYLRYKFNDINCCDSANSIAEAENKIENTRYDLVVLDLMIQGKQSKNLARYARHLWENQPPAIMLVSAMRGAEIIAEEIKADKFFSKPFDLENLDNYMDLPRFQNNDSFLR